MEEIASGEKAARARILFNLFSVSSKVGSGLPIIKCLILFSISPYSSMNMDLVEVYVGVQLFNAMPAAKNGCRDEASGAFFSNSQLAAGDNPLKTFHHLL